VEKTLKFIDEGYEGMICSGEGGVMVNVMISEQV